METGRTGSEMTEEEESQTMREAAAEISEQTRRDNNSVSLRVLCVTKLQHLIIYHRADFDSA